MSRTTKVECDGLLQLPVRLLILDGINSRIDDVEIRSAEANGIRPVVFESRVEIAVLFAVIKDIEVAIPITVDPENFDRGHRTVNTSRWVGALQVGIRPAV